MSTYVKTDAYGLVCNMQENAKNAFPIDPERGRENRANCVEGLLMLILGPICCPCATTRVVKHLCGEENPEETCASCSANPRRLCNDSNGIYRGYNEKYSDGSSSDFVVDTVGIIETVAAAVLIPLGVAKII